MPNTSTSSRGLTDIKETAKSESQLRISKIVHQIVKTETKWQRELVIEVRKEIQEHYQKSSFVKEYVKECFCREHGVDYSGRSENKSYASFTTILTRLFYVAELPENIYTKEMASGKTMWAIWGKLTGDGGKLAKKLNGKTKEKLTKENLLSNAKAGEINSEELATKFQDTNKSNAKGKDKVTSSGDYVMPDTNKQWIKDSRYNVKNDPQLYNRMLHRCFIELPFSVDKSILDKLGEIVKFYKNRGN